VVIVAAAVVVVAAAVATKAPAKPALARPGLDRVGLGWRGELAAGIFSHPDQIDILEVIADDYFHANRRELASLRALGEMLPLTLHGVAMGLASCSAPEPKRLTHMARLVEWSCAESWSEHLAFVRAGGLEIGHLAAPPRTRQNVAASINNIAAAAKVVGSLPHLENIATLIDPPLSTLDEVNWISQIIHGSGAPMLLDFHNLYANAVNFGIDPAGMLLRMPLARVQSVHLSGGHWIAEPGGQGQRLLDDHVHDVPQAVFDLLQLLAQHAPQPLTVVLERDGNYPAFGVILAQLQQARAALRAGRSLAYETQPCAGCALTQKQEQA
jgi:uncharacterized protein